MARPLTALLLQALLVQIGGAQESPTRADQIQQRRAELSRQPVEADEDPVERVLKYAHEKKLTRLFTYGYEGLVPTLGGLVNNQGFAAGVQFLRPDFWNGKAIIRSSARGSTGLAYLFDAEVGMPELAGGKAFLDLYVRERNNPRVDFYGIGPDSSEALRTTYLMEDTTAEGTFGVRPLRWLGIGLTGGYLNTNVGPGSREPSTEEIFTPAQVPGLETQPGYLRGGPIVLFDYRDNPYGPRAGGLYYGRFDYYDARNAKQFSFRRFTAEAQQFVPLFNRKRVIAVRGKTILSYPNAGQEVPFYLQPGLGSSNDLRGFPAFRFYDTNSLILNAEWRWEIFTHVDAAIFGDFGKVFSRPGLINFSGLEKSYGGGLRFRAPGTEAVFFRFDVAASREGVQFWLVFNDIFATPALRTGRELSPPPGRLP
jgi:hypothetical protein